MKKIMLILTIIAMPAMAEVKTYECGDNCMATLDTVTGVMKVSGRGEMWGYDDEQRYHTPWFGQYIKKVIVEDGITNIGMNAFFACEHIETIELAQSVKTVGVGAFDEDSKVQKVVMYDSTVWYDQDNFNQYNGNIHLKINCFGDMEKCKMNFLNTPKMSSPVSFSYRGKRIYTLDEAAKASKKTGNTFKIRYK